MQGFAEQDEKARLDALEQCQILDTPREAMYDSLVFIAAQLFRSRMATFSLLDAERSWFKAQVGMPCGEVGRDAAFCSYVIQSDNTLVIEDTRLDQRFSQMSTVTGAPYIRFCAGAPVTGPNGMRVGALCVFDLRPRAVGLHDRTQLAHLAKQASDLLQGRVRHRA